MAGIAIQKGVRVIITGASSGIGAALAQQCGAAQATVALIARRKDRLEAVAAGVEAAGGQAYPIVADVSQPEQITPALQQLLEQWGGVEVLINNAGRGNCALVEETTPEQLERIFGVNVFALWYTTAVVLPVMKQQGRGVIVNVASVAGKWGYPINSAYVAAKHACVGFTAALRTELLDTSITAFAVCPAAVDTEWPSVTEGCAIGDIFLDGVRRSKQIAEERGLPLAPLSPVFSAEEVARQIMAAITEPPTNDLFTHPGTAEMAVLAAQDRSALEQQMLPFYLGVLEAYREHRQQQSQQ